MTKTFMTIIDLSDSYIKIDFCNPFYHKLEMWKMVLLFVIKQNQLFAKVLYRNLTSSSQICGKN